MKRLAALFLMLGLATMTRGQATPAGIGPGPHLMVGGGYSYFHTDYGNPFVRGGTIYADANLTWRWGMEAEMQMLRHNDDPSGIKQTTYLAGPRYSFSRYRLRPYAKVLGGLGKFDFPFGYATGKYFVVAPGGGVEWERGRIAVKLIDVEYQMWPQFTYGNLRPYGATAGITFRVWGSESRQSDQ